MVHVHNRIHVSFIKKEILVLTVWMALENVMLSELSQALKGKYHMLSYLCGPENN
jgi:hypothetical protein